MNQPQWFQQRRFVVIGSDMPGVLRGDVIRGKELLNFLDEEDDDGNLVLNGVPVVARTKEPPEVVTTGQMKQQ